MQDQQIIRSYCPLCKSRCPVRCTVEGERLVAVQPDTDHPNAGIMCPKGKAAPELVHNRQRLLYPMQRTNPKGAADPGWRRISWDEALTTTGQQLATIKARYGAEAVAFYRPGPGGSPAQDFEEWLYRLAHAFGSPNVMTTTHVCNWHKDRASHYTYGTYAYGVGMPEPDFAHTCCIVLWGHNPHASWIAHVRDIQAARRRGAKLVVIDPRRTRMAAAADLWLQVRPGTDGALILAMIQVMLAEKLFDAEFVTNWSNGPFLVRMDTGQLMRANQTSQGDQEQGLMVWDRNLGRPVPAAQPGVEPELWGSFAAGSLRLATVLQLLKDLADQYPPERATELCGVPADLIREAVRMLVEEGPVCYYPYNGLEQHTNATQTSRALCILYALTGNLDREGGNVIYPRAATRGVRGLELLPSVIDARRLGQAERPLGPTSTMGSITAPDMYRAILTGKPYPVKGLIGIGGNMLSSSPGSLQGSEALAKLDFYVQAELFLTPSAQLADIVLPAATCWEAWHVRTTFEQPLTSSLHLQYRPAVAPPQGESRPDMEIIFDLAQVMGVADKFWNGDLEAAFNYKLEPCELTVEQLQAKPGGITVDLPMVFEKYRQAGAQGQSKGFATPSGRVEIYSEQFHDYGYDPLPIYRPPAGQVSEQYPLTLVCAKVLPYCHGQGRAVPALRRLVPHPYLEINPQTAGALGVKEGQWVRVVSPAGCIRLQARVTPDILPGAVCTQHGWWQSCEELGLPGYDPFSAEGANVNLLYTTYQRDPISGSFPLKSSVCRIELDQ